MTSKSLSGINIVITSTKSWVLSVKIQNCSGAIIKRYYIIAQVSTLSLRIMVKQPRRQKAELFNTYFCSVFTSPNTVPSTIPSNPNRSDVEISDVHLSVEEVELCLAGLDSSKASGPDGIPAHILKQCSKEIAPSVCALFNHSCALGVFQLNGRMQT